VITTSLGEVGFSPTLRAAINAAIDDWLAAAGNQVGFVVSAYELRCRIRYNLMCRSGLGELSPYSS
jgi:hypothetical protein